jgi:16S rRNA (adenine1518-N6/adenine1519-N6)-dimethyltransferase
MEPKKSLGQHWLTNPQALEAIVEYAEVSPRDTVLEIGPGLGHLTEYLLSQARHVVAVELDEVLSKELTKKFAGHPLTVHSADILKFDFDQLPEGYKVVANIPYYLTNNLLRTLCETNNPPSMMVLLVQKEVAERICAKAGQMSILSVSVQLFYKAEQGIIVQAELFEPAPKVDSQVVVLHRHNKPLFKNLDEEKFFRLVKAGFSERRKKLRSSLSGGLRLGKVEVDQLLADARIDGGLRAQSLSLQDWDRLYKKFQNHLP